MKQSDPRPGRYEREAFLLLKRALTPAATLHALGGGSGGDAVVAFDDGKTLELEFRLWVPRRRSEATGRNRVWILPRASRGLRERLRRKRESYVDLNGAVFLTLPNLLVDRVNLPRPSRPPAVRRSFDAFTDRSSLVARTLLERRHRGRTWGVRELASSAGVGPATVTRVIRELTRLEVVRVRRSGRESEIHLTNARGLFDAWTEAYDWTDNQSVSVVAPIGDPLRFLRRSKEVFRTRRWALTLQAGASLIAPHAAWERIHVYVRVEGVADLLKIADQHGWTVVEEGKLILLRPYYRDSVWDGEREIDGLPVVSDLQLALDLWHYPVRGREQAEHLLRTQHVFD